MLILAKAFDLGLEAYTCNLDSCKAEAGELN